MPGVGPPPPSGPRGPPGQGPRLRPPRPSSTEGRRRPESRVFRDSHFHPRSRRPGPQSGLVQTSSSSSAAPCCLWSSGRRGPPRGRRRNGFLGRGAGQDHLPRNGRRRGSRAARVAAEREPGAKGPGGRRGSGGGCSARGPGRGECRLLPSPSPHESGLPTAGRRRGGWGREPENRGSPRVPHLALRREPGGLGGLGRGRGSGKGAGKGGELWRDVASEQLPPPPQPPPPFRFTQTNKMAAVTPRLFLPPKPPVQIGRMFTVKMVPVRLRS